MMTKTILLLISLLLLQTNSLSAKETSFESKYKITHLEAISQKEIFDIHRDSRGFMWIATLDGLVRYDGFKTKTYRMQSEKNSISSNMVKRISEDKLGNIWVTTFGKGLCKLDVKSDRFTIFDIETNPFIKENDINILLVDAPYIWADMTSGLMRYKLDESMSEIIESTEFPLDFFSNNLTSFVVKAIHKSFDGSIWLGLSTHSINIKTPYKPREEVDFKVFNTGGFTFLNYYPTVLIGGESLHFPNKKTDGDEYIEFLLHTPGFITHRQDFTLWIGSVMGIDAYRWDVNGIKRLSDFATYPPYQYIKEKKISCLEHDVHGNLWIGSRGGGIDIMSSKKEGIYKFSPKGNKGEIESKIIKAIYEDSEENLWIGTEDQGINYLKDTHRFDYASGFKSLNIENYPIEYNRAYAFAETQTPKSKNHKRLLWVGTSFPTYLMALDPATMQEKKLNKITDKIGFVFALAVQNDSTLWAGTYNYGLWKLHLDAEGDIIDYQRFTHKDEDKNSLPSNIIRSLLIDKKENLWIATDNGLSKINASDTHKEKFSFHNFSQSKNTKGLSYDYLLQLFESKSGQLWIGSMGGGLIGIEEEINSDSIHFISFDVSDGLPDNTIKGIIEGDNGDLWLSSNKGICKFNPYDKNVINYSEEDGLQDNTFSEMAAFKRKNGDLVFGGYNGFNVIRPELLQKDTVLPQLYFSGFTVLNQPDDVAAWDKLDHSGNNIIEYTESIVLKHNENSFSIAFSGLHFNAAHKNKYRYQLVGFDKQTNTVAAQNSKAKYTNIPRGHYQFKVWGSNCDNLWTETPIVLSIRVKPHPLYSGLAWSIYILLFFVAIWGTYYIIHLFHLRKNEIVIAEIEKQKAEELSQSKLRFFTNISHEFRTPLTLISIPLEKIMGSNEEFSPQNSKNLNIIQQNTRTLLRLVNQILDFRKLEQNKMVLQAQEGEVIGFMQSLIRAYEPLLQEKNIQFTFEHEQASLSFDFDPDKLEKIINNLLSNAVKFTPEYGKIRLRINDLEDKVKISIKDNGSGIAPEEQELVFVRYHQQTLRQAAKQSGTGIGLSLTKALVDLHLGEILLDSELDKGSTFTLLLPKKHNNTASTETVDFQSENNDLELPILRQAENTTKAREKKEHKLLIVEDNQDLRQMVLSIFEDQYHVFDAKDGQEGYDKVLKHTPDLIISDVMMPRMSGLELLAKVKAEEDISHIPVILLTAKSTVEDQIKGHLAGADAYLPKPFNIEILQAKVQAVFENRERVKSRYQKEIEVNPMTIANSPGDVNFMERLMKVIEKNLTDPEFNVDKMAEEYGTSRVNLNRKLKALTGETPIMFLRNIRLKQAAELLKNNDIPVSTAAWEVGFNDLATFRKHFKTRFDMSPSAFVTKHRGDKS